MLNWLYLDFNSYFASVEQQVRPSFRGKPLAVVPMLSDNTCAIAASYEAKLYGIKTGTIIRDAKAKCQDLQLQQARHDIYVQYHHKLLEEIERHIPIYEVRSIDEVACRLPSEDINYITQLVYKIKQGIYNNVGSQMRCSIGVSVNPLLAKIASNLQKPDGFKIIEQNNIIQVLSGLKLNDIPGIGTNMDWRLKSGGVYNLEQFLKLDPRHARKIWGSIEGERMWYTLNGHVIPSLKTTKRTIGHSHVVAPKMRQLNKVSIITHRLLLKAASRMRRYGFHTTRMTISIKTEKGDRLNKEIKFSQCKDSVELIKNYRIAWKDMILQSKLNPKLMRVRKTSIALHGLVPDEDIMPQLFDNINNANYIKTKRFEALSDTMDSINQRFGKDAAMVGSTPDLAKSFTGTKIAFNRIPELEEFNE